MSKVKRKCAVVMVTTLSKSEHPTLLFNPSTRTLEIPKHEHKYPASDYEKAGYITYELCIINEDDIKIGDWTIDLKQIIHGHGGLTTIDNEAELERYAKNEVKHNVKKVLASTENLVIEKSYTSIDLGKTSTYVPIPKLSKAFINKFVEKFNKRKKITDVMVEFEDLCETYISLNGQRVKVSEKDNTITISKVKDSWNREEILSIFNKYFEGESSKPIWFDEWFEEVSTDFN